MIIVNHSFVFSGDIWAETFPEYVNEAIGLPWRDVISSSWAGYLTIIPSFLSKLYVYLGLPLGYIDLYLRAISVTFLLLCVGFIGHPINRKLIPQDWLRVLIALFVLLSARHVSTLSFINVWYAGFIVVALVSLSDKRLSTPYNILFTLFTIGISLTKSSLVLLPLVLYRTLKTKRYISGALQVAAISLQTYLTVFSKNGYGDSSIKFSILDIIKDLLLGASVSLFKIFHIMPANALLVLIASFMLIGFVLYLWPKKDYIRLFVIAVAVALTLYLQIFAPDNSFTNLWRSYPQAIHDSYKLQREVFGNFMLLLLLGVILSRIHIILLGKPRRLTGLYSVILLLLIGMAPLSPIKTASLGVSTSISPYRSALNAGQSVCMPVPPTPGWDYQAIWFFQYHGGCYRKQKPLPIDFTSFNNNIHESAQVFSVESTPKDDLKTLLILVRKQSGTSTTINLKDTDTGKTYSVKTPSNSEDYAFVSLNLNGIGPKENGYHFELTANSSVYTGSFTKTTTPVIYEYFMGYPNIQ